MTDRRSSCCTGGLCQSPSKAIEPIAVPTFEVWQSPLELHWSPMIGGAFLMGASQPSRFPEDGEWPQREVVVSPFKMACHAVTNSDFAAFVRDTNYTTDAERFGWSFVFDGLIPPERRRRTERRSVETPWWIALPRAYWAQPEGPHTTVLNRLHHPVVHISWNDARAYCKWSHARLPTEAEWEFAARGGLIGALYPWGDELTPGGVHQCNIWQGIFPQHNTMDDGYVGTAPVDAYLPNGFGLHNAAGNVWEWCQDSFTQSHKDKTVIDPICDLALNDRVIRGGSFLCHESYCNRYRVGARSFNAADSSSSNIGFRVVCGSTVPQR